MQEAMSREQTTAFVRAFMADTQPVADEDAEDEARVLQMLGWATEPSSDLTPDVIWRVIARLESLA